MSFALFDRDTVPKLQMWGLECAERCLDVSLTAVASSKLLTCLADAAAYSKPKKNAVKATRVSFDSVCCTSQLASRGDLQQVYNCCLQLFERLVCSPARERLFTAEVVGLVKDRVVYACEHSPKEVVTKLLQLTERLYER
jgi:hypothetical protein